MAYKRLGPFIRPVNSRNTDSSDFPLLGVSIQKILLPSIANTVGTDMSTYKIINKRQFAYGPVTSRNGDKISVALLSQHETGLVSQAYTVFEIINHDELVPEYLMMWFMRPEFDRYARFKSHGSARETFDWDEMYNIELPIPSIEKQREVVAEYRTIVDRIKLNEQISQNLSAMATTIFKSWFIDFEPFGGTMPKDWEVGALKDLVENTIGGDWGKDETFTNSKKILCIRGADIPNVKNGVYSSVPKRFVKANITDDKILKHGNIVIELSGGSPTQQTGRSAIILNASDTLPITCSNFCRALQIRKDYELFVAMYLDYMYQNNVMFIHENSTIGVKNLDLDGLLGQEQIVIPMGDVMNKFNAIIKTLREYLDIQYKIAEELTGLKDLLLSKMATDK